MKFELSDLFTVYIQKEIAQGIMFKSTDMKLTVVHSINPLPPDHFFFLDMHHLLISARI